MMNKVENFFKDELYTLKNGVTKLEYLSWWLLRIALICGLIRLLKLSPDSIDVLLVSLNLLASFTVPLARIILFPKKLLKKLPFRCQTFLNILIFFASFLGQAMGFNHTVTSWDKVLHVMAGAIILFIGNELLEMFLREKDRISPLFRTFAATGFSYIGIAIWEVFEFFVDYYWPESNNQAYNLSPERDPWFQAIFGLGAQNENQWAVFDTNVDMLCAVVGSIPAAIAVFAYLNKKEKKINSVIRIEKSKEEATV